MSDYDANPYHSRAFSFAHPDRLSVVAGLFGIDAAPVETARILELGCAAGGNLWPIAAQLPEATCVGIDLSSVQIEQGKIVLDTLGLSNCELRTGDVSQLQDLGEFDYIIAHGLYSWVPPDVAQALLELIGHSLAPNGIAMVSFNVYPGAYTKQMTREMMQMHAQGIDDPAEAIGQARGLLEFLTGAVDPEGVYGQVIHDEAMNVTATDDHAIWHGRLAEHNHPCWFRDFAGRASDASLQYLGDVDVSTMLLEQLPLEAQEMLIPVADDLVVFEQYLDFCTGRSFRRSILVRPDVEPDRAMTPERLAGLHVSARMWPTDPVDDWSSDDPVGFQASSGAYMEVSDPIVKAAFALLGEVRPATLLIDDVVQQAAAMAGVEADADAWFEVASALLTLFVHKVADLYPRRLPIAAELPETPSASPLARLQAGRSEEVTTLRHDAQLVKGFDRALLLELDGARSAEALEAILEPEGGVETVVERLEHLRRAGLILG